MEGLQGQEFFAFETDRMAAYSDEEEEEESSGIDSGDDSDGDDETMDVQEVLEDMFHRMPCVPPGWMWQDEAVVQERNSPGAGDLGGDRPCTQEAASASKEEGGEERIPRWGHAETKELISIKAGIEADPSFSSRKPKSLWDPIAGKMSERGYARSSEQCKRKWKKLVSRYKRTTGLENGRKFVFFADIDELFKSRLRKNRPTAEDSASAAREENQADSDEDGDSAEMAAELPRKRRRTDVMQRVLCDFIAKQQAMEKSWQQLLQRKQREWQQRERDWMTAMERLQQQRVARETAWREREEERRAREEARAQQWDKLFALLLDRLEEQQQGDE